MAVPTAKVNGLQISNDSSPSNGTSPDEAPPQSSQTSDDSSAVSAAPDSMDEIVEGLLLAGLHNMDDDELPTQTNEFYSKVVLGCKPAGKHVVCVHCTHTALLLNHYVATPPTIPHDVPT